MDRGLILLLAVAPAGLAALPSRAQDPVPTPSEVVAAAEEEGIATALTLARELGTAARENPGLREEIARAIEGSGPNGRLALGQALGEAGDGARARDTLLALVEPDVPAPTAEAAAAALGLPPFTVEADLRSDVAEALAERLDRPEFPASVRLRVAVSLFEVGGGSHRTLARDRLKGFLRSEDPELRAAGALALASIRDLDSAREELRRLAAEPTDRGKLARLFLDREQDQRNYDRQITKLREYYEKSAASGETPGPRRRGEGDLATLREILEAVQYFHIRGDEVSREDLLVAAARGMLGYLDPHSTLFTGEEYKRFFFEIDPEYGGIGAFVRTIQNVFTIVRPIYSGPAYEAGLRSDDKVLAVDGWETGGQPEDEIIKRLKGEPGTPVLVRVWRQGWPEPKDITIVRAQIRVPVLHYELFPGGIGYVDLVRFAAECAEELDAAAADLLARGMRGLVLDVRNNEGGLLSAAVEVASRFLPKDQLVVWTDGLREPRQDFFSTGEIAVPEDLPVVVLVNPRSASASEILAGTLQDHGRATIVGEPTFGKGSVQTLLPLRTSPDEEFEDANGNGRWDEWEKFTDRDGDGAYDFGSRLKLTVSRYFLPSGRSIHSERDAEGRIVHEGGVTPDVVVDFPRVEGWKVEEIDRLFEKAVFQEYVAKHFPDNRERFVKIAEGDGGDWSLYPDFEAFYEGLKTPLDRNEIRRWVRLRIRDAVADVRKRVFPGYLFLGDYQEDSQLQAAVRILLERLGTDVESIPEYRIVFAKPASDAPARDVATPR
jgi:carboxyl-terminal processing protease